MIDPAGADGVVAFAGVDWWYHNRGHSECQIMRRLAGQVPVVWVNSIGMRAPAPGKTELPLRRYARKLKSTLKGLRRDESGMWVLSPLFIPRYTPRAARLNARLLRWQVGVAMRIARIRRPSAWVTVPTAGPAALAGRWRRLLFNRSDEFSAFPEVDRAFIESLEADLLSASDLVLYVNHQLHDRERDRCRASEYLGHGVDFEHFRDGGSRPEPAEIAGLARPILGFYGALDDYTVDLELLIEAARAHPEGTLLVIGPKAMEIDRLLAEPNVVYLGPVPYQDLPAYAARFDVGLMPWLRNEWIERCNPIKLKEYLAAGFPVATTPFPELEPYQGLVHVGDDPSSFVEAISAALTESGNLIDERRSFVADSSWDSLADHVAELLELVEAGE